jgi:uncharacterized protein YijF (DUF1287 family)
MSKCFLTEKASRQVCLAACLALVAAVSCRQQYQKRSVLVVTPSPPVVQSLPPNSSPQLKQFVEAAVEQSKVTTGYDPSYVKLDYPNGDVSSDTGVCSDVVVRAFRKTGIDLQKEVHEDMTRAWSDYPRKWGARGTDSNIDHRRVLNLTTYFTRQGKSLPITNERSDYLPGDLVAWELSEGVEHIGILTYLWSESDKHCLVVHNVGAGARIEDVLLAWKIIGHYRYF